MKLKELWHRLRHSEDNKPVTVTAVLMRDDCSRLLGEFSEAHLGGCRQLVIISRSEDGGISVETSDSLDEITALGLMGIATSLLSGGNGNGHVK